MFALLHAWPQTELMALLQEVETYCLNLSKILDKAWAEKALTADTFFSPSQSKALDEAREKAEFEVMMVCSEISSVAQYYLQHNYGVEVPLPE